MHAEYAYRVVDVWHKVICVDQFDANIGVRHVAASFADAELHQEDVAGVDRQDDV